VQGPLSTAGFVVSGALLQKVDDPVSVPELLAASSASAFCYSFQPSASPTPGWPSA